MSDSPAMPTQVDEAADPVPVPPAPSPSLAPSLARNPALASQPVAEAGTDAGAAVANEPTSSTTPIGVLLVNLGTPDAPTPGAVRRYLKEFLTDPRVIEKDSLFWQALLNGVILPIRSRRKARDYQKIW